MPWVDIPDAQTPNWADINTTQIFGGLAFQLNAFQNDAFQISGTISTWGNIDDSQSPGWAVLSPGTTPAWGNINTVQTPGWTPIP
jgi:hypothetical protein